MNVPVEIEINTETIGLNFINLYPNPVGYEIDAYVTQNHL